MSAPRPRRKAAIAPQAAPAAEGSAINSTPKGKRKNYHRRKILEPGQAHPHGKLTDEVERRFCSLIMNQAKVEDAADCLGIHRSTVHDWRAWGRERPESRYGQFEEAITKALALAKVSLIRDVAQHPDIKGKIFILKNRYPAEYRDRIWTEVSGPEGAPIPVAANPFLVQITLAAEPGAPEPEFNVRPHAGGNGNGEEAAG
jgi:hypothetical protein